jgi:hypothetical protein
LGTAFLSVYTLHTQPHSGIPSSRPIDIEEQVVVKS